MSGSLSENISRASGVAYSGNKVSYYEDYRPKLISNKPDRQVLDVIEKELTECTEFWFSVAFITFGGLVPLLAVFRDRIKSGKFFRGHILTTDYKDFTQPTALKRFLDPLLAPYLDVRVAAGDNFHTKGYCFKGVDERTGEDKFSIIIGSSNLTGNALKLNKEWNVQTVSEEDGKFTNEYLMEFNRLWNCAIPLTESWIDEYQDRVNKEKELVVKLAKETNSIVVPNSMQENAIRGLEQLRKNGKNKGLLIAATGTGKTYLSAFDVRNTKPARMLYIVHREQILDKSMDSFEDVLGTEEFRSNCGKLAGGRKDISKKYLFATIQTLSRDDIIHQFSPDYFDYIIIDEVHKAGAPTYRKVIDYFKPAFMLGMSATPDRTDQINIYELFGYNIAYEIRLKDAMAADLVCPFNYFGVTDITVDNKILTDKSDLSRLTADERVRNILSTSRYYGFDGDNLMGLIFCSRTEEGAELSRKINEQKYNLVRNYRTVFLSGENSIDERELAIERLALSDDNPRSLDYIITVDIFNEGIDIPDVNQVIMLRPTESAIIFTQQLGRGLRKTPNKGSVVVLDFIGNYEHNFLIPISLSGDTSFKKDTVRRYVAEGTRMLPGISTMHFDKVARERIYESIDRKDFQEITLIKAAYQELKNKLGHIPSMNDFDSYHSYNVLNIINRCGSYYSFLKKYDKEYKKRISDTEEKMLCFVSSKYASGKSLDELQLVQKLINNKDVDLKKFSDSAERGLSFEFSHPQEQKKYKGANILERKGVDYVETLQFLEAKNNYYFSELMEETVEYGIKKNKELYSDCYKDTKLKLYEQYSYEDVCRLLGWQTNQAAVIGGYKYDSVTDTFVVFINYDKDSDAIEYPDRFVNQEILIAASKTHANTKSMLASIMYGSTFEGVSYKNTRRYLFVRKNKIDSGAKEFYFLGEIIGVDKPIPTTLRDGTPFFEIIYKLETPVRDDIFDYLEVRC